MRVCLNSKIWIHNPFKELFELNLILPEFQSLPQAFLNYITQADLRAQLSTFGEVGDKI